MAPLADLIGRLTRENQELAAAAAMWQERARFLGEQLRALEPGPIAGEMSTMVDSTPGRAVATERDENATAVSDSLIDRLRRLIGR